MSLIDEWVSLHLFKKENKVFYNVEENGNCDLMRKYANASLYGELPQKWTEHFIFWRDYPNKEEQHEAYKEMEQALLEEVWT